MAEIIVPLDVPSDAEAKKLADTIGDTISWYKVGLELFTSAGPAIITHLTHCNKKIFLDLKLHDIPNTVARAVTASGNLGVSLVTLHAGGGCNMMRAAKKAADSIPGARPNLLAVTVLTSMDEADLRELGIQKNVSEHTEHLARLALESGMDGLVCSPHEVAHFRKIFGSGPIIVTPGVRPAGADKQDQKRVATPREAVDAGSNYLVIGRPITGATDPQDAAKKIRMEIA